MADREDASPESGLRGSLSVAARVVRLFWTVVGTVLLFFFAALIFLTSPRGFSRLDVGYLCTVAAALAALYADLRYSRRRNAGAAGLLREWAWYSCALASGAAILWAAVHSLG